MLLASVRGCWNSTRKNIGGWELLAYQRKANLALAFLFGVVEEVGIRCQAHDRHAAQMEVRLTDLHIAHDVPPAYWRATSSSWAPHFSFCL